ncbi:hypothetical protein B0H15DRAFT_345051 [Mycena belliarum]|uniref:F-box domain-containing protein n=1 Tax=Mycena belliarum TaxID=1033014 RepID=A0AAD6U2P9_9AGAR|nr:hypothetical protein B0H15DRAFT_345051 [Mycena belliae]
MASAARAPDPLVQSTGRVNDDVLDEILRRPELGFADLLNISLTSRRWRSCAMPLLFGKHTWSPWLGKRRSFPWRTLWPLIRIFVVVGTCDFRVLDAEKRAVLESHLQHAIQSMTALHTFIFEDLRGGLWPQMLDIISAAPALAQLKLNESPWLGEWINAFDLPPSIPSLPLRKFEYIAPHYADDRKTITVTSKRPLHALQSEMYNLRTMLRASRPSLESVTVPGELILLAFDLSLTWDSLRELFVEGVKPESTEISLLSVLHHLPNLRVVSLRWYGASTDPIVPKNVLAIDAFLPRLQQFQVTSLVSGDRILSILPLGLETLVINCYLGVPYRRLPNVLRASEVLEALSDVNLPAVTRLELWYTMDASDEPLLRYLPRAFPYLRHLAIRRYVGRDPDMEAIWNPAHILQEVLPEFHDLRVFALEADPPERRNNRSLTVHQFARYLARLRGVAEESVLMTPWLREIHMRVDFYDPPHWLPHWHIWDVVVDSAQKACLRPRLAGKREFLEIRAVLEGPLEELGSDSESETDTDEDF